MILYLALPHTIMRFPDGVRIFRSLMNGEVRNENLSGRWGIRESESGVETNGEDGDYP